MKKTAFLFPGQASQYVGMARDIHEEFDSVRGLFERASQILGFDLAEACFEGPEERLKQTSYTQPAVFVHSCAIDMILRENGLRVDAGAGHSLGEYSALVSAGALAFDDAMKAIGMRSQAMQEDCEEYPGTMAAITGLESDIIENVLSGIEGIVVPANYNSPGQVVISGEIESVEDACERLKEAGARRAMRISVGGAYHSTLMSRSAKTMSEFIEGSLEFGRFAFPVYANVSGEPVSDGREFRRLLSRQISSPVLWHQSVEKMYRDGIRSFVEVGPGKVLQGLLKRILKHPEVEITGVDTLQELEILLNERVQAA
jgi:[acyl-carrier-protein] S-malonyltransferase